MLSKAEVENLIEGVANENGCNVFDVILPTGNRGSVILYIYKDKPDPGPKGKNKITHSDCASISKALFEIETLEWLFEKYGLEVSSPGIDRKLSKPKHFETAVGENLKLTVRSEEGTEVVSGVLKSFNGDSIVVDVNSSGDERNLLLAVIKKARVDFLKSS